MRSNIDKPIHKLIKTDANCQVKVNNRPLLPNLDALTWPCICCQYVGDMKRGWKF